MNFYNPMKMHSLKSEQGELCAPSLKPYWAEVLIQDPSCSKIWEILKWKMKSWDIWQKSLLAETLTVNLAF